ncbi:MAG: hypothetical protein N2316_04005 [Spirochaetes bacterium]|nr:hypothetical protein [Spirochaetota bacterium]
MKSKKWKRTLIIAMFIFITLVYCKQARRTDHISANENAEKLDFTEVLEEEFRKEGFISPNIFRVVIIEPVDSSSTRDYAQETAKKRAFLMLKKHLLSENRIVNQNVEATILGIVEHNGTVTKVDDMKKTRNVYFFEIKKEGIKQHIESLAPKR